jgi:hypothetical protein
MRRLSIYNHEPPIEHPNGKRFAVGTLEKAIGGVLTVIFLGLLAFVATGRAFSLYGLPPRVDRLEATVYAPASPMPQADVDRIVAAIVAAMPAQPAPSPKKVRP